MGDLKPIGDVGRLLIKWASVRKHSVQYDRAI